MIDDDEEVPGVATDDGEDPSKKSKPSRRWLTLITQAEKAGYEDYQQRCTNVEKQYADMARLASVSRAREFQIFWANIEVLKPSIYSRPPVPVVVPRFKDRKPLPRVASELLERSTLVAFEMEDIDSVMRQIRDDLAILSRGVPWVRYEAKSKENDFSERVCIEHKNRADFVHDPAREWKEVDWVAGGAWMTKREMRLRFQKSSGKAYQDAGFKRRRDDNNNSDGTLKARVWEIWSKSENKVVWVSPGVDVVLDEDVPHLKLENFFPCPRPAYGTVQRNSLIPVPDYLFIKDQVEEIHDLTGRISALSDSLRLKGFYPAGAGELGDAIEVALKSTSDRQTLVPISNWAIMGNGGAKDTIVWLPLDMVVSTITQLIALRRQLIEDTYQISGLSDIMRGETDPNETLGAQELKSQYGSIRIRDRQNELVRVARDLVRITAEVMAENFQPKTLLEMSQMDLPTDAEVSKQVKALETQAKAITADIAAAQNDPEVKAMAEQNPQAAEQILQQAQGQIAQIEQQIAELKETVTLEKVMDFLRDQRVRPFILDIETDSTIQADEKAEKESRTEFLGALGGALAQLTPMVAAQPETAPFAAEVLKFAVAPFRAGRELESSIEEFAEKMKAVASQPKPDPNAAKADAEAKAIEAETQAKTAEREQVAHQRQAEHAYKMETLANERASKEQDARAKQEQHAADMQSKQFDMRAARQTARAEDNEALVASGLPPIPDPEAAILAALQAQSQQMQILTQAVSAMAAVIAAPKRIIKNAEGRPVGVEPVLPQTMQ